MCNLKYLGIKELQAEKEASIKHIKLLKSRISGHEQRLFWINAYLEKRTGRPVIGEDV